MEQAQLGYCTRRHWGAYKLQEDGIYDGQSNWFKNKIAGRRATVAGGGF